MQVGQWGLTSRLSEGGNSVVWLGTDGQGHEVALKILKSRDPRSTSYRRFGDEVAVLKAIGDRQGVLRLIDAVIPTAPSKAEPAWLAMPLADPLREALQGHSLEDTVAAVHGIANTLADLAIDAIHHRDIKPDNLYWYEDAPALGDFGLVDFPGKDEFTDDSRQLGPAHYIAPEMRDDPVHADAGPADVYSLAKTLWVLASGQRWPPMGHHRLDDESTGLRSWVDHPNVAMLDRLVERATANRPAERPTMREFADELRAWLRSDDSPQTQPDLARFAAPLALARDVAARQAAQRQADIEATNRAMDTFIERMRPVGEALQEIGASSGHPSSTGDEEAVKYLEVPRLGRVHWQTRVHPVGGPMPWLWILFGVTLYEDRSLLAFCGEILSVEAGTFQALRHDLSPLVPIGSARADEVLDDLANRAASSLPEAIAAYAAALNI